MERIEFKIKLMKIITSCMMKNIEANYSMSFNLKTKSYNFYYMFQRYREGLYIYVFKNGNIRLKLKDHIHGDIIFEYYIFDKEDDLEEMLKVIKNDLELLIRDFMKQNISWHALVFSLMVGEIKYIQCSRANYDWREEYLKYKKEMMN